MTTYPVQLAIYDLSHGMARGLSAQFLGPQHAIEIIPHTGIVVYGREYFFGGGIQSEEPGQFRQATGMYPVQVQSLGRTSVSRSEFEQWCARQQLPPPVGKYHPTCYDLLARNCNNFSHDAAVEGLRLSQGVPDWILSIPGRFLSSPMGQMVRPMLQNMQLTAPVQGAHPVLAASTPAAAPAASASATTAAPNPWANVTASSPTSDPQQSAGKNNKGTVATPVLDSYTKPLLSSDSKTVSICVKKLCDHPALHPDDRLVLTQAGEQLVATGSDTAEGNNNNIDSVCDVLLRGFFRASSPPPPSSITYALMLLRLALLVPAPTSSQSTTNTRDSCLEWIQQQLAASSNGNNGDGPLLVPSPAARSMAWLCVANAVGSYQVKPDIVDALIDVAISDVVASDNDSGNNNNPPSNNGVPVAVRQAASAFLYNVTLQQSDKADNSTVDELSDGHVSMLCASLEGLVEEPDATVQLRRLLVVGRILLPKPNNSQQEVVVKPLAQSLVQDLGMAEALQQVQSVASTKTQGDAAKIAPLASELIQLIV